MILSTLKPTSLSRPTVPPPFSPNALEEILLEAQGACKTSSGSGWKLGRMILTDKRFIFLAGRRIVAKVPLDAVCKVTTERHPFVLARHATVKLTWSAKQAAWCARKLLLVTKDIQTWRDTLVQTTVLELTDQAIERVAWAVDQDCATLLRYIWYQGHAGIEELAELIDAASHNDVLKKIRRTINPTALELLGCNLLAFRHSWKTPGNSEPVNFHWWIAGKRKTVSTIPAAQVNIFEETDHVDVIVDLPGVRDDDMVLSVRDNRLIISAASDTEKFREEVVLPAGTRTETKIWRMNNGILLVRFGRLSHQQTV